MKWNYLLFILVSYSEKDLEYSWRNRSVGSDIGVYDREMAQFDIISAKRYLKHEVYHSGKNDYKIKEEVIFEICE